MPTIVLFGDSIIDNAAYVDVGDPDVTAQIKAALPGWTVVRRAVDGDVTSDVVNQAAAHTGPADAVFLSVGGNDALGAEHLLHDAAPRPFIEHLNLLHDIGEDFRVKYRAALSAVLKFTRHVIVATIYNPSMERDEQYLQKPMQAALHIFNDIIQREALALNCTIMELRTLFDRTEDYANPIEPSAKGGAKIAARVAAFANAR